MSKFHPDVALVARLMPRFAFGPGLVKLSRRLGRSGGVPRSTPGVNASIRQIPGGGTARVFVPTGVAQPMPVVLWVHGGGFIVGSPAQDDAMATLFARELGVTVVAPSYRLAPEHPFPAAMDDLYAALTWIHGSAGSSACGPIASSSPARARAAGWRPGSRCWRATASRSRWRSSCSCIRCSTTAPSAGRSRARINGLWNATSNRFGWTSYLGREPGGADVPPYAAPARAESLAGLPPTWIGVGTFDLFHDEDVEYARRLAAAGVPVELEVVPGVFHAFDRLPRANVAKAFVASQLAALRRALA